MNRAAIPPHSADEPARRRIPEQTTPLSIQGSRDFDMSAGATPQGTAQRLSGARRTSVRRSSLTIPDDITRGVEPIKAPAPTKIPPAAAPPPPRQPPPPSPAAAPPLAARSAAAALPPPKAVGNTGSASTPANTHRPAAGPVGRQLNLTPPSPQPHPVAPRPAAAEHAAAPRPAPVAPWPTAPVSAAAETAAATAPLAMAHAVSTEHMANLHLSPRSGSVSANAAICTPAQRKHIAAASVESLCAEKRRLERLSLAVTEAIQSRTFTDDMYALMPRGNQYYEAETCIRRIAGEAFDFSSPAQLQLAMQMCHKNARLTQQNSMFAGAMMSLTSLTNTGTAVESLESFNRFYAQRDTTMPEAWKASYVTAMRQIVIGFQADPDTVLDQFGHHVARLLQHEQLYVALLRHSQGRPLESPAPNLDAEWNSEDGADEDSQSAVSDDDDDDDYSDTYTGSSDDDDDEDEAQESPLAAAPRPRVVSKSAAAAAAPPATHAMAPRASPSPAAVPPRPLAVSSTKAPMNAYNATSGRPPSHSPRVNEANQRARLTPVVGRGEGAAAASAAVRPGAPPAVFKPMPEQTRRSSSAHSDGFNPTRMRDRPHQDPYDAGRGDSPEARPLTQAVPSTPATAPANAFVPPVPRPQAPIRTPPSPPQATPLQAPPPAPRPFSRQGSGTYDAGYFRQSSLTGSLPRSTDQGAFVLRNQEPLSRHATPTRGTFGRDDSANAVEANAPAARSATPAKAAAAAAPSPRLAPRQATAPPAAAAQESVDRPPRASTDGETRTLPPTMSKRQSREKALGSRPAAQAAAEMDPAEKPPPAAATKATRATRATESGRDAPRLPLRAPSPSQPHQRGVTDEGSVIPGVPDTVYSQRSPSPQLGRAGTPRRH